MNTDEVLKRNREFVEFIVLKYDLKFRYEDLVSLNTVYMNFEQEWGFRVFGTLIEKVQKEFLEEGVPVARTVSAPPKKFNIFNFLKKRIDQVQEQVQIYEVREDFIKFVYYLDEILLIKKLESAEGFAGNARIYAELYMLKAIK
jgi:hypothetical protein